MFNFKMRKIRKIQVKTDIRKIEEKKLTDSKISIIFIISDTTHILQVEN